MLIAQGTPRTHWWKSRVLYKVEKVEKPNIDGQWQI